MAEGGLNEFQVGEGVDEVQDILRNYHLANRGPNLVNNDSNNVNDENDANSNSDRDETEKLKRELEMFKRRYEDERLYRERLTIEYQVEQRKVAENERRLQEVQTELEQVKIREELRMEDERKKEIEALLLVEKKERDDLIHRLVVLRINLNIYHDIDPDEESEWRKYDDISEKFKHEDNARIKGLIGRLEEEVAFYNIILKHSYNQNLQGPICINTKPKPVTLQVNQQQVKMPSNLTSNLNTNLNPNVNLNMPKSYAATASNIKPNMPIVTQNQGIPKTTYITKVRGMSITTDCRYMFKEKNRSEIKGSEFKFNDLLEVIWKNRPMDMYNDKRNLVAIKKKDSFPKYDGCSRVELQNYLQKFHLHAIQSYGASEDRWLSELRERVEASRIGQHIQNISYNNMTYPDFIELIIDITESFNVNRVNDPKNEFVDANLMRNELVSSYGMRLKTIYKKIPGISNIETDPLLVKQFYGRIPDEIRSKVEDKARYIMSAGGEEITFAQLLRFCDDVEHEMGIEEVINLCRKYRKKNFLVDRQSNQSYVWSRRRDSTASNDSTDNFRNNNNNNSVHWEANNSQNFRQRRRSSSTERPEDKKKKWEERQKLSCSNCKRKGHSLEMCWSKDVICHRCGIKGHFASMCNNTPKKKDPSDEKTKSQ